VARKQKKIEEQAKEKREKEEMGDAMKALENRTHDSKVEMDILDALDEIRLLNARQSKVDPIEILLQKQKEQDEEQQKLNEEDEALVKSIYGEGPFVKRIYEEEEEDGDQESTEFSEGSLVVNPKISPEMEVFTSVKKLKTEPQQSPAGGSGISGILKVTPKVIPKVVPKVVPKVQLKVVPKVIPKTSESPISSTASAPVSESPISSSCSSPATIEHKPQQGLGSLLGYSNDSDDE